MIFKIYTRDSSGNIVMKDLFSDTDSALVLIAEEKDKNLTRFTDGDQVDIAVYNSSIFKEEEMLEIMNGKKTS